MPARAAHLLVDISAHGLGHLAQTAPILNELARRRPDIRLTIRSGVAEARLRARLPMPFTHLPASSDFGFVMHDATRIDLEASAKAYREFHADWPQRVAKEAACLAALAVDRVLTDVAYLPLAGAAQAGIPAFSMCSLNWADLFQHVFAKAPWAAPIHGEILAAYRSAELFLRLTPAMPMPDLPNALAVAPVASEGTDRRTELRARLACRPQARLVLVAFGGFDKPLDAADWPSDPTVHWLIPERWQSPAIAHRDDMTAFEPLGLPFIDLLRSADAVLTKPGYGTFVEAACHGLPLLYLPRQNWPEQDWLIDWLTRHARCLPIAEDELFGKSLLAKLQALWQQPAPPRPVATGNVEVAALLAEWIYPVTSRTGRPSDSR